MTKAERKIERARKKALKQSPQASIASLKQLEKLWDSRPVRNSRREELESRMPSRIRVVPGGLVNPR
jgi:hypothetical protein